MFSRSLIVSGGIVLAGSALGAAAAAPDASGTPFTADEVARIVALGPWPPPRSADAGNRVSGRPLAIELGRRLFSDPRMSPVGYIACVGCHQTDRAYTDGRARAHGLADLPRNTPALANLGLQRWYGWGGASDSLWMASLRPLLDAREFDSTPAVVARIYARDDELARCYRAAFEAVPGDDAERTTADTAKALAAFVETLVTGRTAFDAYRDALAAGDRDAAARYPQAAQRGLKLFVGAAGCVACHAGPNLSDGAFHRGAGGERGRDAGRHADLEVLNSELSRRLARYADAARDGPATARDADRGAFRTPGLRNVEVTAPYLHDGSADTLREAVAHRDADLDAAQRDDLVAFLRTLTDADGARRPMPRQQIDCAGG